MVARRRPLVFVVAVVLLSSAGLLVAGLVSLWQSARAAERETAVVTERSAALAARALRAALRDPAVATSRVASGATFRITAGRLELPSGFHWLTTPPPEDPELELPIALLARLHAAEAAQRDGDAARAASEFAALVAAADELPKKQERWVELAAAWSAQRRGDVGERDARLAFLLEDANGANSAADFAPDAWHRSVVAGTLVLAAKAKRALPQAIDVWRAAFAALEPAALDALLLELAGAGAPDGALREIAATVRTQRHVLAAVDPIVARLAGAREPLVEALGDEVLVYYPNGPESSAAADAPARGVGALVPPRDLTEGVPSGDGRFVFGGTREWSERSADAIPVVPLIAIVPAATPPAGAFAGRRGLAALVVVLAATFGVGLFVALRMVRREVELTAARARFLTNVTHELKTPLASIRLFAEMLLEGRVESEAKRGEYHRLLASEAERLSALIENVLDLGRLERGERALDLQPRRVDELVREIVDRFAPLAARDGLALQTRGLDVACEANCDRGALAQALVNLLDNSRKYAASGGRVELALERVNGVARLTVRDFGPGIPEEERERVFEPFVRGERQKDGAIPGLGIGLHLARSLMRAQRGELTCATPPDGGSGISFVAELPA